VKKYYEKAILEQAVTGDMENFMMEYLLFYSGRY
jgi:hypothetical protein